jgi:hypothetical protein
MKKNIEYRILVQSRPAGQPNFEVIRGGIIELTGIYLASKASKIFLGNRVMTAIDESEAKKGLRP